MVVAARRMSAATQLVCEHEALSEEPEQPGFLSIRGDDFYCPSISRRRASGADFPKKWKHSQKSSKYSSRRHQPTPEGGNRLPMVAEKVETLAAILNGADEDQGRLRFHSPSIS